MSEVVKLRTKLGQNQTEFWSRVGVTQSAGSRYESGRNVPKPVQLLLTLTYGTEKQSYPLYLRLRKQP
jgi:transcriptional regulator with XRE-family HTH domain